MSLRRPGKVLQDKVHQLRALRIMGVAVKSSTPRVRPADELPPDAGTPSVAHPIASRTDNMQAGSAAARTDAAPVAPSSPAATQVKTATPSNPIFVPAPRATAATKLWAEIPPASRGREPGPTTGLDNTAWIVRQQELSTSIPGQPDSPPSGQILPATKLVAGIDERQLSQCATSTAAYYFVDSEPTAYLAPFAICLPARDDCCPLWSPNTEPGTVIQSSKTCQGYKSSRPRRACPTGYTSVSSQCCPSGYTPWATLLGDQTPCFSSTAAIMALPLASPDADLSTSKPTIAVTGGLLAVSLPLDPDFTDEISPGTIVGIVIGCFLLVLMVLFMSCLICRHRKRKVQLMDLKSELQNSYYLPGEGTSAVGTEEAQMHNHHNGARYLNTRGRELSLVSMAHYRNPSMQPGPRKQHPSAPTLFPSRTGDSAFAAAVDKRDDDKTPSPPLSVYELDNACEVDYMNEVRIARPQRLSRGYPRLVDTPTSSTASDVSVQGDQPVTRPLPAELP